jgi:hypothetical protein
VEVEPRCDYVEVSEGEDREKRVRLGGCFQVNEAEEKLFLGGGQPPLGAGRRPPTVQFSSEFVALTTLCRNSLRKSDYHY